MKRWAAVFSILIVIVLVGRADGELKIYALETTNVDAIGNPELHLLLCGIKMPTMSLRVQTDTIAHDIPWSWKDSTADLWLSIGRWRILIVQVKYANNTSDTATIRAYAKPQTQCAPANV